MAYFNATRSIQPQRRLRPVTEPNSCPSVKSDHQQFRRERTGTYARTVGLKIPYTSPILLGAIPRPVQAPAQTVLEEVTNG